MDTARVLVIEREDWVARLLADGLCDHGFEVDACLSGAEALSVAVNTEVDCIITEMVLPDLDGPSVARAIRASKPPLGSVPVIVLTSAFDTAARTIAFESGVDVYLTKPFRVDDVALQIVAVVGMYFRLTGSKKSQVRPRTDAGRASLAPSDHAVEGSIAQMSVAAVLTLIEMERRSGLLTLTRRGIHCSIDIVAGCAVGGAIGDMKTAPLSVLREILPWKDGRFVFTPSTGVAIPNNRLSIGALMLEAARLDDELARDNLIDDDPISSRLWSEMPVSVGQRRSLSPGSSRMPHPPISVVPASRRPAPEPTIGLPVPSRRQGSPPPLPPWAKK